MGSVEVTGQSEVRHVRQADTGLATTRNSAIDVLRGWAVLSVILLHLNIRVPFDGCALGRSLPTPIAKVIFWSGYYGVIVFFVISGFLITRTSEARWSAYNRIRWLDFYEIRFARIAPTLGLFVLTQSVLQSAGISGFSEAHPAAPLTTTIFSVLTFHLNWLEAKVGYLPGAWDVLWSLCVEELFYFGFPIWARVARPRLLFYAVLVAFVIAGPFARTCASSNEIWQDHSYLSCMGEIAIGCLAALWLRRHAPNKALAWGLLIVGAGLMTLVLFFRGTVRAVGLSDAGLNVTALGIGTAALLVAVSAVPSWTRATDRNAFSALRWLGRNSYEAYLSHLFVVIPATLLWKRLATPALIPVFYALVVAGSAVLAGLIADGFSKPLKDRISTRLRASRS